MSHRKILHRTKTQWKNCHQLRQMWQWRKKTSVKNKCSQRGGVGWGGGRNRCTDGNHLSLESHVNVHCVTMWKRRVGKYSKVHSNPFNAHVHSSSLGHRSVPTFVSFFPILPPPPLFKGRPTWYTTTDRHRTHESVQAHTHTPVCSALGRIFSLEEGLSCRVIAFVFICDLSRLSTFSPSEIVFSGCLSVWQERKIRKMFIWLSLQSTNTTYLCLFLFFFF